MGVDFRKLVLWYIGIYENNPGYLECLESLGNNQAFSLIEDQELLNKYKSYLDPQKIPQKYKSGKNYYEGYESNAYSLSKLEKTSVLLKDSNINAQVKKLFHHEISPLLADKKYLVGLPKAYFVIFEFDELKDEGLLYAERLKEAKVDVKISFYENAFHGQIFFESNTTKKIQSDLIEYLKLNL